MPKIEKKCSQCGEPFDCNSDTGCWCSKIRLNPKVLQELRARFSDCLCEACLQAHVSCPRKGHEMGIPQERLPSLPVLLDLPDVLVALAYGGSN